MSLIEDLLTTTLAQSVPHMKIPAPPFPRMNYQTAMEKVNILGVCVCVWGGGGGGRGREV